MGFTRYFQTDEERPVLMSLEEVKAGILAVRSVVERYKNMFAIQTQTETSIQVRALSENPVEWLCFEPTPVLGGFIQKSESCKTYLCPKDRGIKEMLDALQKAVNNKLVLNRDYADEEDPYYRIPSAS